MKIIKNNLNLKLNIRTQKNYPIENVEFVDITPLVLKGDIYNEIIFKLCNEIKDKNVDYIVSPDARGFLFGSVVANKLKIGVIPVRKKGKLPPDFVEKSFDSTKEYGTDILEIPKLVDDNYKNKRVYIIDDIYATGNTVKSIKKAMEELNANVIGIGVVINILDVNNDKGIFSLIDVKENEE